MEDLTSVFVRSLYRPVSLIVVVSAQKGQGLLADASQWGKLLATVSEDIRDTLHSRWKVSTLVHY